MTDTSRIRELRKKRGYTQIEMQTLTGIDRSTYSKIECGRRHMSVKECVRIAVALNTSMDYILGRSDNPAPHPRAKHSASL